MHPTCGARCNGERSTFSGMDKMMAAVAA